MLKIKLGKAEYEALEDTLKTFYVASGDGYRLDSDAEDVDGLKAKRDELLKDLKAKQDLLKQFEGLDPEKAREAVAKASELEDADLLNKRKFDELIQKRTADWETKEKSYQEKMNAIVANTAEKDLQLALIANGVNEKKAEDLAIILKTKHIKHVEDGGKIAWQTLDGLETVELDKYIPGLKESKADYFNSTLGAGSGAAGSNNNSGNSTAKTWTRAQWDAASTEQRSEFTHAKGQVTP